MPWEPITLAYMAGIIDGEGTISIFTSTHSTKGHKARAYCPRLCAYNNNPALMIWLVENFGGRARIVKRDRDRWNVSYIWEISRLAAVPIVAAILPYLVLKREQAELFLKFRETIHGATNKWGRHGLPANVVAIREGIMDQMKQLNRGKHDAVESFGRSPTYEKGQVS